MLTTHVEDVPEVYHRPEDERRPVVCLDEVPVQLVGETRVPVPAAPGRLERYDYEYVRNGTANVFMAFEPLAGRRRVTVTERRTAKDFAELLRGLAEDVYARAAKIVLVTDNLNIHGPGCLYEPFEPARARRIAERLGRFELPARVPKGTMNGLSPPSPRESADMNQFFALILAAAPLQPAVPDPKLEDLVRRLGHADYATREAAARDLAGRGGDAAEALAAGAKDADPEVAERCRKLLPPAVAAARAANLARLVKDPAARPPKALAGLETFLAVTGDTGAGRQLYAEMMGPHYRIIEGLEADPRAASRLAVEAFAAAYNRREAPGLRLVFRTFQGVPPPLPGPVFWLGEQINTR